MSKITSLTRAADKPRDKSEGGIKPMYFIIISMIQFTKMKWQSMSKTVRVSVSYQEVSAHLHNFLLITPFCAQRCIKTAHFYSF